MKTTVKEFAEKQGIEAPTANAVLVWLRKRGIATLVEQVRNEGQKKGKGKNVYEIPETFQVTL